MATRHPEVPPTEVPPAEVDIPEEADLEDEDEDTAQPSTPPRRPERASIPTAGQGKWPAQRAIAFLSSRPKRTVTMERTSDDVKVETDTASRRPIRSSGTATWS